MPHFPARMPMPVPDRTSNRTEAIAMFLRQLSLHNRTYGMQDITAGQIVGFRDLRLSGGFLMPLFSHFASPMLVSALFTLSCNEIIISPIAGIRKAGTIKCPDYQKILLGQTYKPAIEIFLRFCNNRNRNLRYDS